MLDMRESVAERRSGYYNELAERAKYDKEAFSEVRRFLLYAPVSISCFKFSSSFFFITS